MLLQCENPRQGRADVGPNKDHKHTGDGQSLVVGVLECAVALGLSINTGIAVLCSDATREYGNRGQQKLQAVLRHGVRGKSRGKRIQNGSMSSWGLGFLAAGAALLSIAHSASIWGTFKGQGMQNSAYLGPESIHEGPAVVARGLLH